MQLSSWWSARLLVPLCSCVICRTRRASAVHPFLPRRLLSSSVKRTHSHSDTRRTAPRRFAHRRAPYRWATHASPTCWLGPASWSSQLRQAPALSCSSADCRVDGLWSSRAAWTLAWWSGVSGVAVGRGDEERSTRRAAPRERSKKKGLRLGALQEPRSGLLPALGLAAQLWSQLRSVVSGEARRKVARGGKHGNGWGWRTWNVLFGALGDPPPRISWS